jgi:hypothetical protein
MALTPPKRVQSSDRVLNDVQDGVIEFARKVVRFAPLDSVRVVAVAVAATDTPVAHGLGRRPEGWIVSDIETAATVRRVSWDERFVTLRASASCVVDLIFF